MPAPYHSTFYTPDFLPDTQSNEGNSTEQFNMLLIHKLQTAPSQQNNDVYDDLYDTNGTH